MNKRKYIVPVKCAIPEFSEADSDAEELGMEIEYIGKKIAELSKELTNAKESAKITKLYDQRKCYIDELDKRPARLKVATENIL